MASPREVSTFLPWALTLGLPIMAEAEDKFPKLSKNLWVHGYTTRSLWNRWETWKNQGYSEFLTFLASCPKYYSPFSQMNRQPSLTVPGLHHQYLPRSPYSTGHWPEPFPQQWSSPWCQVCELAADHRSVRSRYVLLLEVVAFYSSRSMLWPFVPYNSLKLLVSLTCGPHGWSQVMGGPAVTVHWLYDNTV